MKKLIAIATCLALSCATEPTPLTTKPDPCLGLDWLTQYQLDCGPGKFFCTPELQKDATDCKLLCGYHSYPIDWVEADPEWTFIRIRNDYSTAVMMCLLRKK